MKTSQALSMDLMIAIVVFIGTIFVFYSIISSGPESKSDDLRTDAERVLESITSEDSDVRIVDGIKVNITKLENLLDQDYSVLKKKIRVKSEFCFFLEDEDGNIVYIRPSEPGVGSTIIEVSTDACG